MSGGSPSLERPSAGVSTLALLHAARAQVRHEWDATSLHRALMSRPRPTNLAASPIDQRPADPEIGAQLLLGRFRLAGATLDVGERGDPWDRTSPSRAFAADLHGFSWMRDLLAVGPIGAAEGLRLTLNWRRTFGRWSGFSWSAEPLERRVVNLACGARAICTGASEAETGLIAYDLARQARHLLWLIDGPFRSAERAAAAALAGTALAGVAGEKLMNGALARLVAALPHTVAADGGHASRSPRAALELLFDLQALDEALLQRGRAAPPDMMRALDRLAGAVRFFTLADGALPEFQGGEAARRAYVRAARASTEEPGPPPASRNGYQRMEGKSLQVMADAAPAATGAWSQTACAQPLAMIVLAKGRRLIVGCGWSPDSAAPQALRLIEGGSTASLGDLPCGEPLRGFQADALGPRLVGAAQSVEVRRQETEGAVLVELAHDGWVRRFGLRHERRLFLDLATDELRGEDAFTPINRSTARDARRFLPFMVRFQVHPEVHASLALDGKSVLLRPDGDKAGWWLRNDAKEVAVETSVYYLDGQPRRTEQVVLRGQVRLDVGARLRWKLTPVEPASH